MRLAYLGVLHDADDFPHAVPTLDDDPLADRVLAAHDPPHERLVDHANGRRAPVQVPLGEVPPGPQRDGHRCKIVRVDHHLRNPLHRAVREPDGT